MTDTSPAPPASPNGKSFDPDAFALNLARVLENSGQALAAYLKPTENGKPSDKSGELGEIVKTLSRVAEYWLSDQARTTELQQLLAKSYLDLWGTSMRRLAGENSPATIEADPRDKRFQDSEWKSNLYFDFVKQLYLLTTQWANKLVTDAEGLDAHTRQKALFYVEQLTNAISPSNASIWS